MTSSAVDFDPRYLAGIVLFNRQEFFDAHEVWESLWLDCAGPERRFYQGLIQAAVSLYHFGNGNYRGGQKLYRTSKAYMDQYPSPYLGLDIGEFWQKMAVCCKPLLENQDQNQGDELDSELIPKIEIDPKPDSWPEPNEFLGHED